MQDLAKEFIELRKSNPDQLIYVNQDMIIPSHITFYELIRTKAKGGDGARLFRFDVGNEICLQGDIRVKREPSRAGKIVEKRWYEKNKHIFPGKYNMNVHHIQFLIC